MKYAFILCGARLLPAKLAYVGRSRQDRDKALRVFLYPLSHLPYGASHFTPIHPAIFVELILARLPEWKHQTVQQQPTVDAKPRFTKSLRNRSANRQNRWKPHKLHTIFTNETVIERRQLLNCRSQNRDIGEQSKPAPNALPL